MQDNPIVVLEKCEGGYCLKITNGPTAGTYVNEYGESRYLNGAKVFPTGTNLDDVDSFAREKGYVLSDSRLVRH